MIELTFSFVSQPVCALGVGPVPPFESHEPFFHPGGHLTPPGCAASFLFDGRWIVKT